MILIMHKYKERAKKLEQIFHIENKVKTSISYSELFEDIKKSSQKINAILLTIKSPKTNIKKIVEKINLMLNRKIPIFLITDKYTFINEYQVFQCFHNGIVDKLEETEKPYLLKAKVKNLIDIYIENEKLRNNSKNLAEERLSKILELISYSDLKNKKISSKTENIKKITEKILIGLNKKEICKYSNYEIELISLASQLYDIGKLFVSDRRGEQYTIEGAQILKKYLNNQEILKYAYNIALLHQERIDGKGKPYGLLEDEIPIYSQIVGIADVYNNLINYEHDERIQKIRNGEYGKFSKNIIEILKKEGKSLF